jgi:hypothetical protein
MALQPGVAGGQTTGFFDHDDDSAQYLDELCCTFPSSSERCLRSNRCSPAPPDEHRSGVTAPDAATATASKRSCTASSPAAPWDVAGTLGKGSESTLRRRRDEWLAAGVFATLLAEAIAGYDRVIELRLERGRPRWQPAQSARGRRGNRPEPNRPSQVRVEVVGAHDRCASCGCRKLGSACDLVLRGALSAGRLAGWV